MVERAEERDGKESAEERGGRGGSRSRIDRAWEERDGVERGGERPRLTEAEVPLCRPAVAAAPKIEAPTKGRFMAGKRDSEMRRRSVIRRSSS